MPTTHHDCESKEYIPSSAAYQYHRLRDEPVCDYALACGAYYKYNREGNNRDWPGPQASTHTHDCESIVYEPSSAAYSYHQARGEPGCDYSLACRSYYYHKWNNSPGEWPGWTRNNLNGHDCDSTDYEPSPAAEAYHRRRGEPSCDYARNCAAYYQHNRRGRPGEWLGPNVYANTHAHTHDCDSNEYEPSGAPRAYHRRRGEPVCDYALACRSYYHHVSTGRSGEWPGWTQHNLNGHDCDSNEYVPSVAAYSYHQKRGETGCDFSRGCVSYYHHVSTGRSGEWPGWTRYNLNGHDCDSTDYEPSQAAAAFHWSRGETTCDYSLACASYARHIKMGRPGEWPGWTRNNLNGHDCDSNEYIPSSAAYQYHRRRGEPACDYARSCSSYHYHITSGLPADAWDNDARLPDNIPTSVYRILFTDAATYYGITSRKDENRASAGYEGNGLLDRKLDNEDYERETLVICPSRTYARYVESSLIAAHNEMEEGILLNIARPTPVLPMSVLV